MDLAAFNFSALSIFVAWVIMVVVRVRYSENTFGKVLMWCYITLLVLVVIVIVLIIATCMSILSCIPVGLW